MFGNGDDYGLYVDISDLLKSVSEWTILSI
jgi:hypothetical protein